MKQFHTQTSSSVITALDSSQHGLSFEQASQRLLDFGPNALPKAIPPSLTQIFLRQFLSPLIYVLLIAALVSLLIEEWSDAGFIFAVLLINAVIGTTQEYSASRSAEALQKLVTHRARVLREGDAHEIDATEVVPGDMVLLEPGNKVPCDLRLITHQELEIDESLLTGESLPVHKDSQQLCDEDTPTADRINMAFAGTVVLHGRATGIAVATATETELGRIARAVLSGEAAEPPLLVRMQKFTLWVSIFVALAAVLLMFTALAQGMPWQTVFLLAVALAVSAIPEGLPVALTVALAVGQNRMARRQVIVKRLMAVEALGSCTFIATDKTGTLTVNELTVHRIITPEGREWEVSGAGMVPEGEVTPLDRQPLTAEDGRRLNQLGQAATLANEGFLGRREEEWIHNGDAVDVALLVLGHKLHIVAPELAERYPPVATLPFEPENRYSASCNWIDDREQISVKGAIERLLPMCDTMLTEQGPDPIHVEAIARQAHELAADGYRVLAFAGGLSQHPVEEGLSEKHLTGLTFYGLVGMLDPLRPEAKDAVAACNKAGIQVAMLTGDHPTTAAYIARDLGLASSEDDIVTGGQLSDHKQHGPEAVAALVQDARVFARIEPQQKLEIVKALEQAGHFVAMTGDGANDAPALRAAHVGVAMGKSGTDVARDTAELIIADDNFASIVAGVEEGRIAYSNVRKVIFLLISTGAAEIVLFTLALFTGLPLPLLAVQLLWLNLVTNGIQDIALAFEPGEGHELRQRPRPPGEPIFNRLMIERVLLSALVIGVVAYSCFAWLLQQGWTEEAARNGVLLLMVLFENVQVFNSRSEQLSAFRHNPMRNRLLLFGTLAAQAVHIAAMYTPGLSTILQLAPVTLAQWGQLLALSLSLLLVIEAHKFFSRGRFFTHHMQ